MVFNKTSSQNQEKILQKKARYNSKSFCHKLEQKRQIELSICLLEFQLSL